MYTIYMHKTCNIYMYACTFNKQAYISYADIIIICLYISSLLSSQNAVKMGECLGGKSVLSSKYCYCFFGSHLNLRFTIHAFRLLNISPRNPPLGRYDFVSHLPTNSSPSLSILDSTSFNPLLTCSPLFQFLFHLLVIQFCELLSSYYTCVFPSSLTIFVL